MDLIMFLIYKYLKMTKLEVIQKCVFKNATQVVIVKLVWENLIILIVKLVIKILAVIINFF